MDIQRDNLPATVEPVYDAKNKPVPMTTIELGTHECSISGMFVLDGDAIVYKKVLSSVRNHVIATLFLPAGTVVHLRSGMFDDTDKCRASEAYVLDLWNLYTRKPIKSGRSFYCENVRYEVGKAMFPVNMNSQRSSTCHFTPALVECGVGIHFFRKLSQAKAYR